MGSVDDGRGPLEHPKIPDSALITGEQRALLADLFARQFGDPGGANSVKFRAAHDEHLDAINEMVSVGWIEQQDRNYSVSLVGVSELALTDPHAENLAHLFRHIFNVLRPQYKRDPEGKILVRDLARLVDTPEECVRRALPYLRRTSIFGGSSIDFAEADAYVVLSEEIIRKRSFDEVLAEQRGWVLQHTRSRPRLATQAQSPHGQASFDARVAPEAVPRQPATFRTPFETYIPVRQLGQGASGLVWLAAGEGGDEVAIKYLDPEKTSSERVRRFRNEIRFCQRSAHPNILSVLDTGEVRIGERATPFYVMPRYHCTLRVAMGRGMAAAEAIEAFEKILDGVEAAHVQKVWHRDLKPENILVSEDLKDVRVADFGIAHFEQDDLYSAANTKVGDRLANFRYAAPEQRDPKAEKDHRTDIFALGLVLNEMFTGDVPHGTAYRKIGDVKPELVHLDAVVERMIRQRPTERPASIAEVRALIRGKRANSHSRTAESSTVLFSRRFAEAFPGARGIQFIRESARAIERLRLLLAEPLVWDGRAPIWWWRSGDLQIEHVSALDPNTILVDGQEFRIDWIAAVNAGSYYQQFVYVQTLASEPSGLYDYSYVEEEVKRAGFAREEFGLYRGRPITRAEYDDGSAVIDGRATKFEESPELRVRYLTPYNVLIAAHDSPINNGEFDSMRDSVMNRILRNETELGELVEAVLRLPKRTSLP